jgi:hypothetical protein
VAPTQYPFPDDPAATDYCVFPAELEGDDLVLFHATPIENLAPILKEGFRIPDPNGITGLQSVSFAKQSVAAFTHAMIKRAKHPGEYCIIAVRYMTLQRKGLTENFSDIHDYTLNPAPETIAYCVIPSTYTYT